MNFLRKIFNIKYRVHDTLHTYDVSIRPEYGCNASCCDDDVLSLQAHSRQTIVDYLENEKIASLFIDDITQQAHKKYVTRRELISKAGEPKLYMITYIE